MALLNRKWAGRARKHLVLLLCASAATGCALISVFGTTTTTFGFSHALHAEEGLECGDCHFDWDSEDAPGMPTKGSCMLCHEDIDSEKPPERRIDDLFTEDEFKAQRVSALSEEVKFSHLQHVNKELECSSCHTGIEESQRIDANIAVSMADCQSCHTEQNVANDCRTCHERLDIDVAPDSHLMLWTKMHGAAARAHNPTVADNCSLCHDESSCRDCHQTMEPESHNNYFRSRAHGLHARMDRQSCAACHRADSCDACHQDSRPMSHNGAFAGTLNTHCLNCHLPVQSSECATCHKGTPSHATATPKPPGHTAGMDCRQCHGMGQPMPHVDKGDDCNSCHQ